MSDGQEAVRIELSVPAPLETVWRAFRVPAEIRRWHGWEYDGLDAEIHTIFEEETTASEPDQALEVGGHLFRLEDLGDRVVVRVTRAVDAPDDLVEVYDEIEEGWLSFLQQLRFALTRHPGEDRRTVFLAGGPLTTDPATVVEALGLAGAAEAPVGKRYRATTAWGEAITGERWFRTDLQLGVTVDQWGDGLLIAARSPHSPSGAASLLATAYGMDDAALESLRTRMTEWWASRYGDPAGSDL